MYEKVVIPTDGSDISFQGVKEGLRAAKAFGIPALAIYVITPSAVSELGMRHGYQEYGSDMTDMVQMLREQQKKRGEKILSKVKEKADEMGVKLEMEIKEGPPNKEIVEIAGDDDIIYICSHGRSGIKSLFLGSTTERVIKRTKKTTVAVVKANTNED